MRMWMVNPKVMCRKHLLGEHVELHMLIGTLNKGVSVHGYLTGELMEPANIYSRHEELIAEMGSRGYNHKSNLPTLNPTAQFHVDYLAESGLWIINREKSLQELIRRCPDCAARHRELNDPTSPK